MTGAFVDRIVETKGVSDLSTFCLFFLRSHFFIFQLDFIDKEKAKRHGKPGPSNHFVSNIVLILLQLSLVAHDNVSGLAEADYN